MQEKRPFFINCKYELQMTFLVFQGVHCIYFSDLSLLSQLVFTLKALRWRLLNSVGVGGSERVFRVWNRLCFAWYMNKVLFRAFIHQITLLLPLNHNCLWCHRVGRLPAPQNMIIVRFSHRTVLLNWSMPQHINTKQIVLWVAKQQSLTSPCHDSCPAYQGVLPCHLW